MSHSFIDYPSSGPDQGIVQDLSPAADPGTAADAIEGSLKRLYNRSLTRRVSRLLPVATRPNPYHSGLSSAATTTTGITYRRSRRVTCSSSDVVLHFGNWYNNNGSHTAGLTDINVKASELGADGFLYPVYFGGKRAVTIEPGGVVVSDVVGVEIVAGTVIQSLTWVSVAVGGKWPVGLAADGTATDSLLSSATNGEGDNSAAATGDVTMTPGNTTATLNVLGYSPQAILGVPTRPAVRSIQQHVRATSGLPVAEWIAEAVDGGKIPVGVVVQAGWLLHRQRDRLDHGVVFVQYLVIT